MVHEVHSEPEYAPSDVDDVSSGVLPVFSIGLSQDVPDFAEAFVVQALLNNSHKSQLGLKMKGGCQMQAKLSSRAFPMPRYAVAVKKSLRSDPFEIDRKPYEAALPLPDVCHLASTGDRQCHAILDTGASKCVIGEKIWKQLFQKLPSSLQQKVRKAPSQVKFRFGNNQTLQSEFQVQLPLQSAPHSNRRLWLTIEVLLGSTPFLFSKRAFKQLGGILDTTNDSFFLQRLDRKINLELNPTELYLLDVIQLCSHPPKSFFKSSFVTNHVSVQSKGVDCPHGPHDSECTVENISLTMAKPASRDSSSRSPCQSSSDSQHAASSPDDDVAEDRGRGGDQPVDDVAQVSDQPVRNCTRGPRKFPGSDASHGGNGPRAAESTNDVAKSHDFSPERPATKAQGSTGDSTAGESSPQQLAPRQSPSRVPKTPPEVAPLPMASLRVAQVLQEPPTATFPTAAMTSRVSNWQMIEESEAEVILDLEGRQIDLNQPSQLGSTTPLGVMIPRASTQMTVADWGQCRVTWGKKHKGRTYMQVWRQDPSYYQWAVARFASLTPEVQDFVRFCQVKMDLDQRSN